jgi:hypothetical protein
MKGADQCPRCASRRTARLDQAVTDFYSADLLVCGNCGTAWEPFDPAELVDPKHEPLGAFKHPCSNCAFRKGSPEQRDAEGWESKMIDMSFGASFYCHKGVPVAPASDHGFAYPEDGKNPRKLRLCRGYLNSIVGPRFAKMAKAEGGPQTCADPVDEPWIDA